MFEAGISPGVTFWMFDFDGTLASIVADRTAAELDPACRSMLHQLAKKRANYCAVISSRLLADLEGRVDIPGIYLSGGSGLEWKLPDGHRRMPEATWMDSIKEVRETLIPEIREWSLLPGVEIEDKQWSERIHQPQELLPAIRRMSTGSLYFHFLKARRRPPVGCDDFTAWLPAFGSAWQPYIGALRELDFYFSTLSQLKGQRKGVKLLPGASAGCSLKAV